MIKPIQPEPAHANAFGEPAGKNGLADTCKLNNPSKHVFRLQQVTSDEWHGASSSAQLQLVAHSIQQAASWTDVKDTVAAYDKLLSCFNTTLAQSTLPSSKRTRTKTGKVTKSLFVLEQAILKLCELGPPQHWGRDGGSMVEWKEYGRYIRRSMYAACRQIRSFVQNHDEVMQADNMHSHADSALLLCLKTGSFSDAVTVLQALSRLDSSYHSK